MLEQRDSLSLRYRQRRMGAKMPCKLDGFKIMDPGAESPTLPIYKLARTRKNTNNTKPRKAWEPKNREYSFLW